MFRNRITDPVFQDKYLRRFWPVLLIAVSAVPLQAQVTYAEDLFPELTDLMYLAADEGPEAQLVELGVEEKEGDLDVARSQRRPRINMYARLLAAYEWREDIDDRLRGRINANLSMTQPLYYWGNLKRREEVAEDRLAAQKLDARNRGLQSIMRLRRSYLEWLLVRERREILRQSISLSDSYVDARRQLVDAGRSSEQDVLEMEARLLEKSEALARTEKRSIELAAILRQLVGPSLDLNHLQGASLSDIEPMSEDAFRELESRVRGQSGEYLNLDQERWELLVSVEEKNIETLDKNTWPSVDFVAGFYSDQIDGINQADPVFRVQAFAGLQMNWNIFDGWQNDGWKRGAMARKRGFELQADMADEDARRQAETLLAELQLNLKQIEARGKRESILSRRLELLNNQMDLATVTGADLIEAEIDYLQARQGLMEARVDYLMNLMELGALLGLDPALPPYASES